MSMSLKRTVAALLLCTSLATHAVAQNTDLPDVSIVATAPRVDLNAPPPDPVRNAIVATQDVNFFERYPAPSTLTQQITSDLHLTDDQNFDQQSDRISVRTAPVIYIYGGRNSDNLQPDHLSGARGALGFRMP